MNKRLYDMAPGGRMALDKAENRRKNLWHVQRLTNHPARNREKRPVALDSAPRLIYDDGEE